MKRQENFDFTFKLSNKQVMYFLKITKCHNKTAGSCVTLCAVSVTEAKHGSCSNLHCGLDKKSKQNWMRWPVPWWWLEKIKARQNEQSILQLSSGEWAIEYMLLQVKLAFQHSENIFKFELTLYNHSIPTKQLEKRHEEQHRILIVQKQARS